MTQRLNASVVQFNVISFIRTQTHCYYNVTGEFLKTQKEQLQII